MRSTLNRAMQDSDRFVVELDYCDSKGESTHRVISPIRFLPGNRLLALCLCREEPRQFHLNRCSNIKLRRAEQFVMPLMMTAAGE